MSDTFSICTIRWICYDLFHFDLSWFCNLITFVALFNTFVVRMTFSRVFKGSLQYTNAIQVSCWNNEVRTACKTSVFISATSKRARWPFIFGSTRKAVVFTLIID